MTELCFRNISVAAMGMMDWMNWKQRIIISDVYIVLYGLHHLHKVLL